VLWLAGPALCILDGLFSFENFLAGFICFPGRCFLVFFSTAK